MLVEVISMPFFVGVLWFFSRFDFQRIADDLSWITLLAIYSIARRLPWFVSWILIGVMVIIIKIIMTLTDVLEEIIFPDY